MSYFETKLQLYTGNLNQTEYSQIYSFNFLVCVSNNRITEVGTIALSKVVPTHDSLQVLRVSEALAPPDCDTHPGLHVVLI